MNMPLPGNPVVTVNFEGLMLLVFERGLHSRKKGYCQVALVQPDERHCLNVTGTMASGEEIDLPDEIEGDIILEVPGRYGEGVETHEGEPYDDMDHENDFRWLIDLQTAKWHGKKAMQVMTGKILQRMFIHQGLIYTTQKQLVRVFRKGLLVREAEVARKIACNLYLKDGEKAVLRYGAHCRERIELPFEPEASHTISVSTLCDPTDSPDNDFQHYYNVLEVEDVQFEVRGHADNPGRPVPRGEGRLPCNPVCLGRIKAPI